MMAERNKIMELQYFDLYGRAHSVRMALWYCNVDFKDTRIGS